METNIENNETNIEKESLQDNQESKETNLSELEKMTNEQLGWTQSEQENNEQNIESESENSNNTSAPIEKNESADGQAKEDDFDFLTKETPYKNIKDIVKGYKSLQSEMTKKSERYKDFESMANRFEVDANFKQYINQALSIYDNPQLAQAYTQTNNAIPDPRDYDLYSEEGLQKYNTELGNYMSRQLDDRLNTRFKSIDQQNAIERARLHLKEIFPEANSNEVENFILEKNGKWNLSDVYKIMNYDKLKDSSFADARKEIQKKIETASTNSPATSSTKATKINSEDIVRYIIKNGLDSAKKKYGASEVMGAQTELTNNFY